MWTYVQASGQLLAPSGACIGTGYAGGNCGKNPDGVNNPAMENVSCVGPLPCGTYTIGSPADNPKLGPFAIPLAPSSANAMFGRSAFFIHGDTSAMDNSASEGCIILARSIRNQIAASTDKLLQVIAHD